MGKDELQNDLAAEDENGLYEWDKLIAWNRSDWDADASNGVGDSEYVSNEIIDKYKLGIELSKKCQKALEEAGAEVELK